MTITMRDEEIVLRSTMLVHIVTCDMCGNEQRAEPDDGWHRATNWIRTQCTTPDMVLRQSDFCSWKCVAAFSNTRALAEVSP